MFCKASRRKPQKPPARLENLSAKLAVATKPSVLEPPQIPYRLSRERTVNEGRTRRPAPFGCLCEANAGPRGRAQARPRVPATPSQEPGDIGKMGPGSTYRSPGR